MDARPLTEPVDQRAAKKFERANRPPVDVGKIFVFVLIGIIGAFILSIFGFMTVLSLGSGQAISPGMLLFVAILVAMIVFVVSRLAKNRVGPTDRYRLSQFAGANGMTYLNSIPDPPLPGMIFRIGRARTSSEVVRGARPRFVEFGNYRFTTGYGEDATTRRWGYVAIKLDVPLPHIVLDATGNNSAFSSNLPATFDRSQKLSLEGDFDRYFTLYCPQGYERDALYLFTPDIMAHFINNATLDVEIVDEWLFLYTRDRMTTPDAATWARLFGTVDALMAKLDQWARWHDDHR
ncbi:hypothetical protein DC31_03745 [Microbacterium sp. CH12i]|uniref:GlsB/YeaQ/YmgE family stress response membrane protein n=1 Tax=Microbacterium sp. CH12i TaxID=1479651 RepID=UPI0004612476|nr:hypothetical protein [Microbacterium sp. CH12i]KDA05116.1 hypothetical protein DC31_03745 [Microbacterium sp. CH12i]